MIGISSTGLSRREFLERGLTAVASTALLTTVACASRPAAAVCTGTDGLSPEEIRTRATLEYVDRSSDASRNCSNCELFQPPSQAAGCGGCDLVKGPFSPLGYCNSWVGSGGVQ